jgi:hypothetical protein
MASRKMRRNRSGVDNVYALYFTAYSACLGPHTPVEMEAKNDAKDAMKKALRAFVNQYLRFPPGDR